jgi:hypothetical protein
MAADRDRATARPEPSRLTGGCHCGDLELTFQTRRPGALTVRACGCSFCRSHCGRTVSHPDARVEFVVHDPAQLTRYGSTIEFRAGREPIPGLD